VQDTGATEGERIHCCNGWTAQPESERASGIAGVELPRSRAEQQPGRPEGPVRGTVRREEPFCSVGHATIRRISNFVQRSGLTIPADLRAGGVPQFWILRHVAERVGAWVGSVWTIVPGSAKLRAVCSHEKKRQWACTHTSESGARRSCTGPRYRYGLVFLSNCFRIVMTVWRLAFEGGKPQQRGTGRPKKKNQSPRSF